MNQPRLYSPDHIDEDFLRSDQVETYDEAFSLAMAMKDVYATRIKQLTQDVVREPVNIESARVLDRLLFLQQHFRQTYMNHEVGTVLEEDDQTLFAEMQELLRGESAEEAA